MQENYFHAVFEAVKGISQIGFATCREWMEMGLNS